MNHPSGSRVQGRRALGLLGLGLALALGWALRPTSLSEPARADNGPTSKPRPTVAVAKPRVKTLRRVTRLPCDLLAQADTDIHARTTGYVREVSVDVGSRVEARQPLAHLDVPDTDAARATAQAGLARADATLAEMRAAQVTAEADASVAPAMLAEAAAAVERARATLARAQADRAHRHGQQRRSESVAAASPGSISQDVLDEARTRALLADADVQVAQGGVTAAQAAVSACEARMQAARARADAAAAAVASAQAARKVAETLRDELDVRTAFAVLRAPFAGLVVARWVDPGDLVRESASGPLFRLIDDSRLRIRLRVPEGDACACATGSDLTLSVDGLPGKTFKAQVSRVAAALDLDTRSMLVEADVENPERMLRHGMFGRVVIELEAHPDALVVPAGAVTTTKRKSSVLVVEGEKVVKRSVTLGADDGVDVQVTHGLGKDDLVIVRGAALVAAGDRVEAVPLEETPPPAR